MRSIREIFEKNESKKCASINNYVEFYDYYFHNNNISQLLEIGNSINCLMAWLEYLPQTLIYNLNTINTKEISDDEILNKPGLINLSGELTEKQTWDKVPKELDMIICSAEDNSEKLVESFELGFTNLKSSGIWIFEDCHNVFKENVSKNGLNTLFFWFFNQILTHQSGGGFFGGNFSVYSKNLNWPTSHIKSFKILKSMLILEKL